MIYFRYLKWLGIFLCLTACASQQKSVNTDDIRARAEQSYAELDRNTSASNNSLEENSPYAVSNGNIADSDVPPPVLMVLPAVSGNSTSALQVVTNNPFAKAAMEGANEFLTEKGYDVRSLEGNEELSDLIQIQNDISGNEEDMSYIASLAFGADIYIKFSGAIREDMVTVEVSAYETSTARLLGSKMGMVQNHSHNNDNQRYLVHTAIKKALMALEETIHSYWKKDLKKGNQYKVIIRFGDRFSDLSLEEAQDNSISAIRGSFSQIKINRITGKTMDLVIYSNPTEFPDAYAVYSSLREILSENGIPKKNNITNKLIIMELN